jgi:hypothetical protein
VETLLFFLVSVSIVAIVRGVMVALRSSPEAPATYGYRVPPPLPPSMAAAVYEDNVQRTVELRILHIMAEFPELTDESVAVLMRDELVNTHVREEAPYRWATPDTVARLRRNVGLHVLRGQA